MTIDPNATYTILGSDLINCITQSGYLNAKIVAAEAYQPHPRGIYLTGIHKLANAQALQAANAIKDPEGNPLPSDTFGGSGTVSGTTPSSGGTNKGT